MSGFSVDVPCHLEGYEMKVERHPRGGSHFEYDARVREIGGSCVASGVFLADADGRGFFEDVYVSPGHRRRGVATAIYDGFEAAGLIVCPSDHLDEDGALFWESRLRAKKAEDADFPSPAPR
jgi:GNAT superfamily N-acetyltransferase